MSSMQVPRVGAPPGRNEAAPSGELLYLQQRRARIDSLQQGGRPTDKTLRFSLALSGGGIRSATYSLGVLQAMAEEAAPTAGAGQPEAAPTFSRSLLSRCDYLSTVSGGGYVGAFFCSLFKPNRMEPQSTTIDTAADQAVAVLASGPPGRIRAEPEPGQASTEPLGWLRENGRYLVPTGVGDAMYAGALGVRNWLAVHYVVGTVLIPILCLAALLRFALASTSTWMAEWEHGALKQALVVTKTATDLTGSIWWSSLFVLWVLPVMLWAVPVGIAYFFSYRIPGPRRQAGSSSPPNPPSLSQRTLAWLEVRFNWAVSLAILLGCVLGLLAWFDTGDPAHGSSLWSRIAVGGDGIRPLIWRGAVLVLALAVVYYWSALTEASVAKQRVLLTRWLSSAMIATGVVLAFAVVETLGQTLYLWVAVQKSTAPVLTPAALVTVLVWATKRGAASFSKGSASPWLSKLPLTTLGGIAGIVIFALVACLWSLAITALIWNGDRPDPALMSTVSQIEFVALLSALAMVMAWVTGKFPGFINLSSLQSFYSARLIRAYLGASNGNRFSAADRRQALSAAEPLPDDDLRLESYFQSSSSQGAEAMLTTHAPVHIINVTLNKTVDPAEQLVQRDRKGQPLAVLPFGYTVDGFDLNMFRTGPEWTEVQQPLSIGQWIGTSGAAFSTGIGRETSLGMSLLMGAANVRLGTWWESGIGTAPGHSGLWQVITHGLREVFKTQAYLSYEFRARFFGMRRPWQYLSDGGHFENTGLYELLRRERQQELIIASDNGADPDYIFADLANLIRLARIDLRREVSVVRDFDGWPELAKVFGGPEDFAREVAAKTKGNDGSKATARKHRPVALLLRVADVGSSEPACWAVSLKPSVRDDTPADIRQYSADHPAFPQEPTTDQFFDEAQWESYRSLGHWNTQLVLNSQTLACLRNYMKCDGRRAPPAAGTNDVSQADLLDGAG